jgi:hypothetical protein
MPTRHFGNHPRIVGNRCGCRSESWEELMGRVADVCQSTPHDDPGSYEGGDSEVKMTRPATGALRWPQRGSKTRGGTSSKEVAPRLMAASWVAPGAGMPRDGRRSPRMTWPRNQQPLDPMENPGTSTKTSKTSARRRSRRSPMLTHETSPVSGASVVGMTNGACHGPS